MPTGPIVIPDGPQQDHLLKHGQVYAFRASERTTGETYVCFEYSGEKQFDCTVEQIGTVTLNGSSWDLLGYVDGSGYSSAEEWLASLREIYEREVQSGYIYEVRAPTKE